MATYNSDKVTANSPMPYHGDATDAQHLHSTVTTTAAVSTSDTLNVGYLPNNAVVTGAVVKCGAQVDSNGSPTFSLNVGISGGSATQFYSASTVGRTSGASADASPAATGRMYKNTSGAKQLVVAVPQANPATDGGGRNFEFLFTYFVEE